MKRIVLAVIAVYAAWAVMDYVIHGVILSSAYMQTAQLWRPMAEMKMGLMRVVMVLVAISFVLIYAKLISRKSLKKATIYGALFGFGYGVSMGYGSYAYMPITYTIAFTWFFGSLAEMTVAGLIVGSIIKDETAASND
jgi:hypothetical protein